MWEWLLTGGMIPWLLLLSGLFFGVYLKGYPFRAPLRSAKALMPPKKEGGMSPLRALCMALAGTLGVGNILGVANALAIGGAGSVFWMWVSAFFAMLLKYAEILLAVRHRRYEPGRGFWGGAYCYIKDHFDQKGRHKRALFWSGLFAVFMIVNGLSMGCIIQSNASGEAVSETLGVPIYWVAFLLMLFTLPFLLKGSKTVATLTGVLVPVMSGGYVILSLAVILLRHDALPHAMSRIFEEAFTLSGVGGGIIGFFTSRALRTGTMRGLISNEGGCGTAPTAHACADAQSPADQGVWGMVEVFVDTILLCTLTALAVLVADVPTDGGGMSVALHAYSSVLGDWAGGFLAVAVFCFAWGTVLCWGSYGRMCLAFLTRNRVMHGFYIALVAISILLGTKMASRGIWLLADFSITVLTTLNIVILLFMRREIKEETLRWAEHPKKD